MNLPTARRTYMVAVAFVLATVVWPAHADGQRRVRALSNAEIVAATGKSISEWGAAWWTWAFENPQILSDTTGEFGELGDVPGRVFFAEGSAGDPVRARYKVPGGEYILLPVASYIWTFFDPCAEISCARQIINRNFIKGITDVFVRVDGKSIGDLKSHLVKVDGSNPQVFLVDAGPIGEDGYGGILPALQGGYWVMLEPLPPGTHILSFGATIPQLDPFTGEPLGGTLQLDAVLKLRPTVCRHKDDCR